MKQRVKSVLNYKKPAFWVVASVVVACIIAAVCLLTDPMEDMSKFIEFASIGVSRVKYDGEGKAFEAKSVQFYKPKTENVLTLGIYIDTYASLEMGSRFDLYDVSNGKRVLLEPRPGTVWPVLKPDQSYDFEMENRRNKCTMYCEYKLSFYYDLSKSGYYRFEQEVIDSSDGATHIIGVDFRYDGEDIVFDNTTVLGRLKQQHPEFFGLNDDNGLTLIITQFSSNGEPRFAITDAPVEFKKNFGYTTQRYVYAEDMKLVLASYNKGFNEIYTLLHYEPFSDYALQMNEEEMSAYCEKALKMLAPDK